MERQDPTFVPNNRITLSKKHRIQVRNEYDKSKDTFRGSTKTFFLEESADAFLIDNALKSQENNYKSIILTDEHPQKKRGKNGCKKIKILSVADSLISSA